MTNIERFDKFVLDVQGWAEDKGIYEHSTYKAQTLKALSELGELADAYIKQDREALKDAIGDVAVCLINVAKMRNTNIWLVGDDLSYTVEDSISDLAYIISCLLVNREHMMLRSIVNLQHIATLNSLDFLECCEAAWNEIKDRKGRMVEGGAFIKEEDDRYDI